MRSRTPQLADGGVCLLPSVQAREIALPSGLLDPLHGHSLSSQPVGPQHITRGR
jgi:hypothetical protein